MRKLRLLFAAFSVCLATGSADAEPLWISRVMTLCSVPVSEPAILLDRLLEAGFVHATLPLDDKTAQDLALIELVAIWQPARLKTSSPTADWDEFQSAFNQYADGYAKRLAKPGTTLLIDPETGSLLLIIAPNQLGSVTFCALGVPQSVAVAGLNFPRLTFPHEPDIFAVETTDAAFKASRLTLQEVVVAFDSVAVGERLGKTFGPSAVFSTMVVAPEWAVTEAAP